MGNNTPRQFKTNPVEIAIFLAVTTVFVNSVYKLFYESPNFKATALTKMEGNPTSEGRVLASSAQNSQSFLNLDLKCEAQSDQETLASKVRLSGTLCGTDVQTDGGKLMKTLVSNTSNKFNATVFTDVNAGKYSTDYIPLNSGKNLIHIEFTYRDGKVVGQDFSITKN